MASRSLWSHARCQYRTARNVSSLARDSPYDETIQNLRINSDTRVIIQGFTGKQASFDAKQSLEYGTKIVGGVRPGKDGEHLGLPVLPSVRAVRFGMMAHTLCLY